MPRRVSSMSARPRVSVVMTAYNQARYIPEAIDSILAQEFDDFELILVDDGSTEDIAAVVAPYGDKVRFIRRENGGLAAARNTGWKAARGEYVAFCDADDIHLPYRLSVHAAVLDQCPEAAQVYSDLATYVDGVVESETTLRGRYLGPVNKEFDEALEGAYGSWTTAEERRLPVPEKYADRRVYQGRIPHLIATYHIAWGGASMYRRAAIVAVGGHLETLRRWPDWYLASRLSKCYELVYVDIPVLWYRMHGGQLTTQREKGLESYRQVVYKVWKSDPIFRTQFPGVLSRIVQRAASTYGKLSMENGDWDAARDHYIDYIREKPLNRGAYTKLAKTLWMASIGSRLTS